MRGLGYDRPRTARGLLPLLLAAYSVGKGIFGAVNANQAKQRNKGYIEDAYRGAVQRQNVHETDVRQGTAESLNARGLLTPGAVTPGGSLTANAYSANQPTTLGGQVQADTGRELGLERHDLEAAHQRAQNENKADYLNNLVGAAAGTAQGIAGAYNASQTMRAFTQAPRSSPAAAMSLSGEPGEGSMIQGAYGIHPLTGKPQGTMTGFGQSNSEFHVGG